MWQSGSFTNNLSLGALANAGRAKKNDICLHLSRLSYQMSIIISVQFQFGVNVQECVAYHTYNNEQTGG